MDVVGFCELRVRAGLGAVARVGESGMWKWRGVWWRSRGRSGWNIEPGVEFKPGEISVLFDAV